MRAGASAANSLAELMAKSPTAGVEAPRDAPEQGQTRPSRHGRAEPRLPHEHDESSDSHPGTPDKRVEQAARDLTDGQQDTGRSPVVTEIARKEFPSHVENSRTADGKRG